MKSIPVSPSEAAIFGSHMSWATVGTSSGTHDAISGGASTATFGQRVPACVCNLDYMLRLSTKVEMHTDRLENGSSEWRMAVESFVVTACTCPEGLSSMSVSARDSSAGICAGLAIIWLCSIVATTMKAGWVSLIGLWRSIDAISTKCGTDCGGS